MGFSLVWCISNVCLPGVRFWVSSMLRGRIGMGLSILGRFGLVVLLYMSLGSFFSRIVVFLGEEVVFRCCLVARSVGLFEH